MASGSGVEAAVRAGDGESPRDPQEPPGGRLGLFRRISSIRHEFSSSHGRRFSRALKLLIFVVPCRPDVFERAK